MVLHRLLQIMKELASFGQDPAEEFQMLHVNSPHQYQSANPHPYPIVLDIYLNLHPSQIVSD